MALEFAQDWEVKVDWIDHNHSPKASDF